MMGTFLGKLFQAGDQLQLLGNNQTCIENIILHKVKTLVHGWKLLAIVILKLLFKGSLTRDFWLQVFFTNQVPPGPWVSYWYFFGFPKILGDIHNFCVQRCQRHRRYIIAGVVVNGNKLVRCRWHRWLSLFVFSGFPWHQRWNTCNKISLPTPQKKNKSNITTKYEKTSN